LIIAKPLPAEEITVPEKSKVSLISSFIGVALADVVKKTSIAASIGLNNIFINLIPSYVTSIK
jgi:hypothetical protein